MSNNREDRFEGQDDSEYHFSDEEVSYEVESETPNASSASSSGQGGNRAISSRLTNSRRMLISFGVFLAIVFVVYKVVSPSSSTPPTEITAAPAVAAQTSTPPANPSTTPQVAAAPPPAPPVAATTPPPVAAVPVTQPAASVAQPESTQAMQPSAAPAAPLVQNAPAAATLPAVIPVQSALPAGGQSPADAMGAYIEGKSQALTAASQQVMTQIQSQYTQQFTEFTTQNKALQSQIQTLSTRVTNMEAQINQLVQVLTRRNHGGSPDSSMNNPPSPPVQQVRHSEVKIAYNVQAIIPGRAWLKSANGETLTVAEGDVIRDVGRVTKIDPYDGVVEINTGTKAVSLSYGNGG